MRDRGRQNRRVAYLAVAGAGLLFAAACLESSIVQVSLDDLAEVRVTPDSAQVAMGRNLQAQALTLDGNGTLLVGLGTTWSSLDPSIASVDADGLVLGVDAGATRIVVSAAGFADTAIIVVAPPPILVLSADSVSFPAQVGEADPAPDTIQITNGGTFPLVDLAVDSVTYAGGATDWLTAQLSATVAPSQLELTVSLAGITVSGVYAATVHVSATDAVDSPAEVAVVLDLAAGPAASIELNDGDTQTSQVGVALPVSPSVLVKDVFDNPVAGAVVTFAVTGGGGSVTGSPDTTDASGIARVGSWVLGGTKGANALDATLAAVGTVAFTATGVPGPATRLQILTGSGQSAVAGSPVSTSPSVTAFDAFDNGVQGVGVVFAVTSGGGSIADAIQSTDTAGVATAGTWTLGTTAGANSVTAEAPSIPDTVTFTATGLPGGIDQIVYVAGNAQTDTVAATLPVQYSVKVEDVNNNGIPGVTISWQVTGGGGTITATSNTDSGGIAVATRVLGTAVGTHTARATLGGVADTINFTATATVGTPAKLVAVSNTVQNATVNTNVPSPPSVRVTDNFDNPIAGHSVTFAVTGSNGAVSPTGAMTTLADGTATLSFWRLGTLAATLSDTVEVTPAGGAVAPNPLRFTATANPGAATSIAVVSGGTPQQTAVTGTNVGTAPTVRVTDAFGNNVPSRTVTFTPSGSGSVGSAAPSTNASGLASTTWAVNVGGHTMATNGTFQNTLTATIQGTAISTSFTAFARYSYAADVNPLFAPTCTGCHFGTGGAGLSGLSLAGTAAQNHAELTVNAAPTCDAALTTWRRARTDGGDNAHTFSVLRVLMEAAPNDVQGACGDLGHTTKVSAANLDIIRAWIRNGAPNN